jgi:DNA recombination protein RmuC
VANPKAMTFLTDFLLGFFAATVLLGFFFGMALFRSKKQLVTKDAELSIKDAELSKKETERLVLQSQIEQGQKNGDLMADKFELLASRIFEEKNTRFLDQSVKNITTALDPFKERLKDFEKKVEESYSTERSERGSLKGELQQLMQLNLKMSSDAESLTKALRGDNRTQGAWGEMILESILEKSGLRKGEEYVVQGLEAEQIKNEDGTIIRPDVIINLPDSKHIIIDSKVSLTAYDQYINCETPEDRERYAKAHTESLRRQMESLSSKKYHTADKLISPDFVILFMPLEPAFALAMKMRPELQQDAWDKRVALVSPTTLLVTLKMVSALWKTERQERNALEIAEKGGQLYDKFASLVNDLENMGKKIEDTQKTYDNVMSKLRDGRGNLIRQVDQLRELGVKTSKRLQLESLSESPNDGQKDAQREDPL